MKMHKAPREFMLDQLPEGMSKENIDDHYNVLYKGYVNKFNEIQDELEKCAKVGNPTYSRFRELKKAELFTADAIRLHEAYFECLGGDGHCDGTILELVDGAYGSYENWVDDMRAAGMSARGWVVLAYDMADNVIRNYTTDIHSDGAWASIPLLVLDVYEHAYYMDWGADRKGYIESWLQNINWENVNALIKRSGFEQTWKAA